MTYYAHTAEDENGKRLPEAAWQKLSVHLQNVASLAAEFAKPFHAEDHARLAGLLHDLGKYRDQFQEYLRGNRASSQETQHAIYGAAQALQTEWLGEIFAVAGHHAGLRDKHDVLAAAEKVQSIIAPLTSRFESENGTLRSAEQAPPFVTNANEFSAELYTRFLFSCLVDADRLDTACWPNPPQLEIHLDPEKLLESVCTERERKHQANPDSPLSNTRNLIFEKCLQVAGQHNSGFFSLTVPTGGGKTLSAMAFALAHAKKNNLRRVIVVIPYLSIIEQNASEYRKILGDEAIAEIHSSVEPQTDASEEEKKRLDLVSENWDAPVIITTSVQFIESLFASSPARCRKLHRIARSVVIFDEVQTLPSHLLAPTFNVFRELQKNYGVSFVFSSATPPAFKKSTSLPDGFSSDEVIPILDDSEQSSVYASLQRVRYHLPVRNEEGLIVSLSWDALSQTLSAIPQVLCVVNLTRHASELWEKLSSLLPANERPIHLSSAMCPAHRLALINRIKRRLKAGLPCRVISTQLIEAGVDVDFPVVYRAFGPLDSIVQVAGRCNREGRLALGEMHIFQPEDNKLPGTTYQAAAGQAAIQLARLASKGDVAEQLATDPSIFADYFDAFYQCVATDRENIQEDRRQLRFRTVSEKAKIISDGSLPVIIPVGKGGHFIKQLRERQTQHGQPRFTRDDLRRLQRYMVNVSYNRFTYLENHQLISLLLPNLELYVLNTGLYHGNLGLVIENRPQEDFLL